MKVYKRLNSNRGATIIFAIAILLVAAVISLAIIAISLTSAQSSAHVLEDEQGYLAVSSAARILEKEIASKRVFVTEWKASFDGHAAGSKTAKLQYKDEATGTLVTVNCDGDTVPSGDPIGAALVKIVRNGSQSVITVEAPNKMESKVKIEISKQSTSGSGGTDANKNNIKAVLKAYDAKDSGMSNPVYTTSMYFNAVSGDGALGGEGDSEINKITSVCWSTKRYDTKRGSENESGN